MFLANNLFAGCYSFIPYAYNGKFVYLPKSDEFCFNKSDGEIFMKTNNLGARLINLDENKVKNKLYVFGDSQILGIDWSDKNNFQEHDLTNLFPDKKIIIYAAPNNGPLQSIERIKEILIESPEEDSEIIIGFNYGTDIFRILDNWNIENFIPLDEQSLDKVLRTPILYDLIIIKGMIEGKYFTITKEISNSNLNQFVSIEKNELMNSISSWIKTTESTLKELNMKKRLIIYPPYWGFEKDNAILLNEVNEKFSTFICDDRLESIFDEILIGTPKEKLTLSGDGRHFSNSSLKYYSKEERNDCI